MAATALLAPTGTEVTAYGGVGTLPYFNPDLDVDTLVPEPARRLRDEVARVDALLLACPG